MKEQPTRHPKRRSPREALLSSGSTAIRASTPMTESNGKIARQPSLVTAVKVVFEQKDVEIPASWSQLATNVVVSKYFRGPLGTPKRERSVKNMINRVTDTIAGWGRAQGYFAMEEDADAFHAELKHIILHQRATFNSPVWFNAGVEDKPQCSACFILSVDDSMDSILEWCKVEGMIFKGGSGAGVNLSRIRSSKEMLSSGGQASGPVSFMRAADSVAGSIKSGGKTRRAAKMVVLDIDHPDVVEFIWCKANEERKAYALGDAGWDMTLNGDAWSSIQFQNANNSVRVTQDFLDAVDKDEDWTLHSITSKKPVESLKAADIMSWIAEAAWQCGDPGMQYDTIINDWHTCPNTGRINASNPCSEYMHLDNSACNLASINLLKYLTDDGTFDVTGFIHTVNILIMAQDIIVDNASYPTEKIGVNARAYRQLGLGYANLGALLMALGLPYDSDGGRAFAGAVTALMTGQGYNRSAELAEQLGTFDGYEANREPMLRVMEKHRDAVEDIQPEMVDKSLLDAARTAWDNAPRPWQDARVQEQPGHGAGAHGYHRLHDGLRHDGHRARYRPGQVQTPGGRRHDEDREPHRDFRPGETELFEAADRAYHKIHR